MRVIESAIVETAQEREKKQGVLSTFGDPGKICFLDIETTGFSRTYDTIYLIGLVYYTNDTVMARQYLASRRQDEALLLKEALEFLSGFDTLITYNGDMFDLPFIRERARLLRQWTPEAAGKADLVRSVDLMRRYRRHQKFFGWPNMKLKTVESCLGIGREDPFDGGQLIDVFDEYEKTQDPRLEKTLLLHNYEDIVNLRDLLKVDELLGILEKGHPLMARLRGTGGIDFEAVGKVLMLTMFLYAVGAFAQWLQAFIMTNITQKIVYRMRRDISEKISRMPVGYFERVQTGEILSRITNDVDTLGQALSQSISNFIWAIVSMAGIVIVMLTINVTMTIIALMVIPLSAAVMAVLIKVSQPHFKAQQEYLGIIDGQDPVIIVEAAGRCTEHIENNI